MWFVDESNVMCSYGAMYGVIFFWGRLNPFSHCVLSKKHLSTSGSDPARLYSYVNISQTTKGIHITQTLWQFFFLAFHHAM